MTMIKVSPTSRTAAVAGAIAGVVREHHRAEVQAIGAGAVNQALKAVDAAIGCLEQDGIHVQCVLKFADATIDDWVGTAIRLIVEPQSSLEHLIASTRLVAQAVRSQVTAEGSGAVD